MVVLPRGAPILLLIMTLPTSTSNHRRAQPTWSAPCQLGWVTQSGANGTATVLQLSNGFVRAGLRLGGGHYAAALVSLRGDFRGGSDWGARDALGAAFRLRTHGAGNDRRRQPPPAATLQVRQNSSDCVWVSLHGVVSDAPRRGYHYAVEIWEVRLRRGSRELELNTTGRVLAAGGAGGEVITAITHNVGFAASSLTGHFGSGVVQARGQGAGSRFLSNASLGRLYALGEGTSVDVRRGIWRNGSSLVPPPSDNYHDQKSGLAEIYLCFTMPILILM
jgi:hypothetical protein